MKRAVKHIGTFVVVLFAVVLGLFQAQCADAKTKKPYKAKTVRVVATMENKIHQTKSPVKKVKKISKDKNFKVRLIPNDNKYIFVLSGADMGKKQAVKVYYENGRTQVITFKTETNYLDKIKKELKPLLANPDAGLKKSLEQWEQRDMANKSHTYQFFYERSTDFEGENHTTAKYERYKEEDIYKKLTTSQKKALILEVYVHSRSHYRMNQRWIYSNCDSSVKFNRQFQKLYNGKFAGVCADGGKIAYDIGRAVGLKTKYVSCETIDHAWCVVKATDENGKPYWHGIYTTAHGYSLNASISRYHTDKYSKKQIVNNLHEPCYVHIVNRRMSRRDVLLEQAAEKRAKARSTATTITNCKCPGCYATSEWTYKHTRPSNSYITNRIYVKSDGTHVYEHNGNGYKQWFDAQGNEYFDANGDGSIMDDLAALG